LEKSSKNWLGALAKNVQMAMRFFALNAMGRFLSTFERSFRRILQKDTDNNKRRAGERAGEEVFWVIPE